MILYKDWGKHIRLGNWLFLYTGINSMAKKAGNTLYVPDNYFLWDYLEKTPHFDRNFQPENTFHFRQTNYSPEEQIFIIDSWKNTINEKININLGSHLQSELWFKDDIDYVKSIIKIKESIRNLVYEKYWHIFKDNKKTIGISVRRGDFIKHGCFYQIPVEWYTNALEAEFPDWRNCSVVIFSDDIEECKRLFKDYDFFYADPNGTHTHAENFKFYHQDPMEQFILGTLMNNFIISQSTFSWWQAWYVDKFNSGKIVHCGKNLDNHCLKEFYNPDYYPESWTKFEI